MGTDVPDSEACNKNKPIVNLDKNRASESRKSNTCLETNRYINVLCCFCFFFLDQLLNERVSGPGEVSFSGWFFFPHHAQMS